MPNRVGPFILSARSMLHERGRQQSNKESFDRVQPNYSNRHEDLQGKGEEMGHESLIFERLPILASLTGSERGAPEV